jgi:hypothetical protein
LADPEKRLWVERHPTRVRGGYQVQPFDVPRYNTLEKTIRAVANYENKQDWVNFEMGYPYEDAETSFIRAVMDDNTVNTPILPRIGASSGCVLGCDIGKTSHVIIGKRVSDRVIDTIYCETIKQTGKNQLVARLQELSDYYGVIKGVIDAGPDFSTALQMIEWGYPLQFFGNYYVKRAKTPLSNIDINEEEQVVNSARTPIISAVAKLVNAGGVRFHRSEEVKTLKDHLGNLKRVSTINNEGELVRSWVKTDGPDHYAHALFYLYIADMMTEHMFKSMVIPVLPFAAKVRIKSPLGDDVILRQI